MNHPAKSFVFSILCVVLLSACGQGTKNEVVPADTQISQIEGLMEEMFAYSSKPGMRAESDSVMDLLSGRYNRFVAEFPTHEMAPIYLDRAANIARSKKDYQGALDYYQRIVDEYPNFENIVDIKFLIAFVYDAELNDKDKARAQYQKVADEYPNHKLGRDAKQRMQNLHMSDKELIESFEKKNKIKE